MTIGRRAILGLCLFFFIALSCAPQLPPPVLQIAWEEQTDGQHVFYRFFLTPNDDPGNAANLQPALANGTVQWTLNGQSVVAGSELYHSFPEHLARGSPFVSIDVEAKLSESGYRIQPLRIQAKPFSLPDNKKYLTLGQPQAAFLIPGQIQQIHGPAGQTTSAFELLAQNPEWQIYRSTATGFYNVRSILEDRTLQYNLFISPVPSFHLERTDLNWYYTQFRTETTSNCGPTIVSMALAWSKGVNIPVAQIRRIVGWQGGGGVTMEELRGVLRSHAVAADIIPVRSAEDIIDILAAGYLVGLVYDMAGLPEISDPVNNLFGQYYTDNGGHYLAIKGYSLDHRYLIIQDPIPSDWSNNNLRYHDDESMLGRNRYYPADELFRALRRNDVLRIPRQG